MIFFLACMSGRIEKLENNISDLQVKNQALEARVTQLEKELKEVEQSVAPVKTFSKLFDASLRSSESLSEDTLQTQSSETESQRRSDKIISREKNASSKEILLSKELQQRTKSDLKSAILSLRLIPWNNADRLLEGYRVSGVRKVSLPYQLGIKNGDIVIAVNGKPVYPTSEAMDRYGELGNGYPIHVLIIRRGQNVILKYSVND